MTRHPVRTDVVSRDQAMQDVAALDLHFERFSHWPLAWHEVVMRVLRLAPLAEVRRLYVKEKLGGLAIQGCGGKLLPAIETAERQANRTCVTCGSTCERAPPPSLPRCADCRARDGNQVSVVWVEPITG